MKAYPNHDRQTDLHEADERFKKAISYDRLGLLNHDFITEYPKVAEVYRTSLSFVMLAKAEPCIVESKSGGLHLLRIIVNTSISKWESFKNSEGQDAIASFILEKVPQPRR